MNNLYSVDEYNKLRKQARNCLIISLCILVFGIAFVLLSGLLVKKVNVIALKAADSVVLSLCLCAFLYLMIEEFRIKHNRHKFISRLLSVSRYEGTVKVLDIRSPLAVIRGIKAYEISVINDNGKPATYYLEECFKPDFESGDTLKVIISANFITEYSKEEQDNA